MTPTRAFRMLRDLMGGIDAVASFFGKDRSTIERWSNAATDDALYARVFRMEDEMGVYPLTFHLTGRAHQGINHGDHTPDVTAAHDAHRNIFARDPRQAGRTTQ